MPLPESNLPPDAQKWRRAIEKDLAELKKAVGIAATNLTSTRARFTGVASQAAAAEQVVQEVVQEVGAVADEANRNDRSSWEPKPPENPRHNQRWFDTTDGNLMRVWIDHGEYPRINYALNPNFSEGTENWTLTGGDLVWQEGFDPHADLVATADGATFVLEEVQGRTVSLELEETEDDEDGEGGSEQSFVGVPWSASAHLTAYSDNLDVTAVLEVVDTNDNVLASSGPVVLPVEQVTVVQAPSVLEEYDIVGAKIRLTVTGVDEGDYVSLDKIMLEAIAEPEEDYFDGDMPGVTWETLSQGTVSVWSGEPDWYVLQDENAIQTAIDGAKDTLANAFTTSVNAPVPADGAGRPDGAYWTQINAAGEQVARWRWVASEGQWVSTPLAVEFIPEAYVDFLAANVAFINALEAEIIRADMFQGREFVGGTFTGTRFRTATSGQRWDIGNTVNRLDAYAGVSGEIPGELSIGSDPNTLQVFLFPPHGPEQDPPSLVMYAPRPGAPSGRSQAFIESHDGGVGPFRWFFEGVSFVESDLTITGNSTVDGDLHTTGAITSGINATLGTTHLNLVRDPGDYVQPSSANATVAQGYPPVGRAGHLEVVTRGQITIQRYTDFRGTEMWIRHHYGDVWGGWARVWEKDATPYAQAAGTTTIPTGGGWTTRNFPSGRFTATPTIVASVSSTAGSSMGTTVRAVANSPTEFQVHASGGSGSINIDWIAVQHN